MPKPILPVIPGVETPVVEFAKTQPQYITLPAWRGEDGTVVTRWRMTFRERLRILFTGDLWLTLLTFNHPLQPVKLDTLCPLANDSRGGSGRLMIVGVE